MIHKVIIIGSGPAGLTAGIYLARAKLNPLIIEGNLPGGQLITTSYVENWPGNVKILGAELMKNIKEHAKHCGANFLSNTVVKVDFLKKPYSIFVGSSKELKAESIIIATGSSHKKLNIPGESEYFSKGVSTCATCDGPFFQDKEIVVIGGGNTAVSEASFLTRFAKKITIVQNLDKLTATDPIKDKVLDDPKIEIIYNNTVKKISGDKERVSKITIENQKTKEEKTLCTSGIFVAIGLKPNTELFFDKLHIDRFGYLKLSNNTQTSKEGIFAAGDVFDSHYMQAITASGFGCMAALDCEAYLRD